MISAIVAADNNWGIGYNGNLLEHIPADLKDFKQDFWNISNKLKSYTC